MTEIHERKIGRVTHWFSRLGVAAIDLTDGDIHVGDRIHIIGHTTDLVQPVRSLQIQHHTVGEAHTGESVGMKVGDQVREHDDVYVVTES